LVQIGFTGASLHVGKMYTILLFLPAFFDQAIDHNSQRILMYYGSKDSVWRKDMPFEYSKCYCLA